MRLGIVAALCATARAFDVVGVEVLASQLLPVGFAFGNDTLAELSACRFAPGSSTRLTFADDAGALVAADVTLDPFAVAPRSRVVLGGGGVDSEGLAYDASKNLYVSSESEADASLGIGAYDAATGALLASPFALPPDAVRRARKNAGYEGLTVAPGPCVGDADAASAYVVTTTEYALRGDDNGTRTVEAWRLPPSDPPAFPAVALTYAASTTRAGEALGVVEFEALERSLLVLERDYTPGVGNLVRLFEAEARGASLEKRLVFEWDGDGARGPGGNALWGDLAVDNYEGMCLAPAGADATQRRLLLVNDDNRNPDQIGTQFVLLRLGLAAAGAPPVEAPKDSAGLRVFILIVTLGIVVLAIFFLGRVVAARRAANAPPVLGDPGLMLTSLHFAPPDVSGPYAPVLANDNDGDESPSAVDAARAGLV